MSPDTEISALTRGSPSAYPSDEVALAFILCVPQNGYGWRIHQGKAEVGTLRYDALPETWEQQAAGDETIRRYVESMGVRCLPPIVRVPDRATPEWAEACRRLFALARRVGVSPRIQARLDRVEAEVERRWPVAEAAGRRSAREEATLAALAERFRRDPDGEEEREARWRNFRIDSIRSTLDSSGREAVLRTPRIEAALAALEEVGARVLFEELPDRSKQAGLWWRVAASHPYRRRERAGTCREPDPETEALAAEILTEEELVRWRENKAWEERSSIFNFSGEGSYGKEDEAEELFYRVMIGLQSGPWTWPLLDRAVEIFGAPEVDGSRLTFTPLTAPWTFQETTTGLARPRRLFPCHSDSTQSADLLPHALPRYYALEQLVDGIVVPIHGARYRVRYPLVEIFLRDPHSRDYPDPRAPVILERTSGPVTRAGSRRGTEEGKFPMQLFGSPCWVQSARYPAYRGRAGHVLFTLHDGWGDCGTTNLMFCADEQGVPVRVFHEASCC